MPITGQRSGMGLIPTRFKIVCGTIVMVFLIGARLEAQPEPKLDNLIVYGKGFAFGVKEPVGWRGDTGDLANKHQVNIIFSPSQDDSLRHDVTIRVRVNKKQDENTIEDLNYDMEQYRKKYPPIQFSDLKVIHPEYKTFAKTAFLPGQFYEYAAYLNPGEGKPFIFSVAMSKKSTPATDDELKAFESVLKSVLWLTASVITK
jgi:hypothetical protein